MAYQLNEQERAAVREFSSAAGDLDAAIRQAERAAGKPRHAAPQVRSEATKPSRARRFHWDRLPLVALGFVVLGLWWGFGGKWTIDGLPLFINEVILKSFHVGFRFGAIARPVWYAVLCWVPFVISFAEHKYAPWRSLAWSLIMVYVIGVWLIVSGLDFGSTFLALTHPAPDDSLIAQQVATIKPLAALWALLTTFAPEIGMSVLWGWLWEPGHAKSQPR